MTICDACSIQCKEDKVFALWSLPERKEHTSMNDTGKNNTSINGYICHRTVTMGPQERLLSSASW